MIISYWVEYRLDIRQFQLITTLEEHFGSSMLDKQLSSVLQDHNVPSLTLIFGEQCICGLRLQLREHLQSKVVVLLIVLYIPAFLRVELWRLQWLLHLKIEDARFLGRALSNVHTEGTVASR